MSSVPQVTTGGIGAVIGARVRTLDPAHPEAEAVAWVDGRIVAVGSTAEVSTLIRSDRRFAGGEVVDLGGATLTPGLIDSHIHPIWGAELSRGVDLSGLVTLDEVRSALAAVAARTPEAGWVQAWNLDYAAFSGHGIRADLIDDCLGGRPFVGVFYDLHTAVVSSAAIRAEGLTGSEEFGDAASVVVGPDGRPTGELKEPSAYLPVMAGRAETDPERQLDRIAEVLADLNRVGLTGGVVMDGDRAALDSFAALEASGRLTFRFVTALWHHPDRDDAGVGEFIELAACSGRRWRSGAVKIFSDGVIDTGTAWLREPDTCGCGQHSFWPDPDRLREVIGRYSEAGLQLAIHAVGDQAVGFVMDCYAGASAQRPIRHRLEHLELLGDADIARLAELGVVASMQPLHMRWRKGDHSDDFATRLGPRVGNAFRSGDILAAGGRLCLGSDWPVADADPRYGMAWARLRRRPGETDAPVFGAEQALTGEQALLGYTRWAAEALGEADRGRIAVGDCADLTAFAEDPVHVNADDLVGVPIRLTVVDGEVVYREDS